MHHSPAPRLTLLAALFLPALSFAQNPDWERQHYIRDLDPLEQPPRESGHRLEVGLSASYVFDLGSDAKNQEGWGASMSLLALPKRDPEYQRWQMMFGGEFYGFSTEGDTWNGGTKFQESIDSGIILLNFGGTYDLTDWLSIGALVGTGMGGSYGETKSIHGKERNGNWNYALQIKPMITFHLSEAASLYAAYRFAYIGPMYQTDLVGYDTVTMLHQSAEVGFTWRF